mmetsp:Transcript_14064/g.20451  ORF Transcript_14064/g.20451 Transcript_14064/m.20451 type:complete len:203 (+) Transcript_14064:702-1310(+)
MLITVYGTFSASNSRKMVQQNSQYSSDQITTLCLAILARTNCSASSVTGGIVILGGAALSVDAARAFSSSVMSAGMSAKRGVLKYLSPVSGSKTTIEEPSLALCANSSATASNPPPLVPVKIPSFWARSLAVAIALSPPTWTTLSKSFCETASPSKRGIKSVAQPWSKWGRQTGCGSLNCPSVSYSVAIPLKSMGALSGSHT